MSRIRVLVVDDSPTMRALIAAVLEQDAGIEIAGFAGDPLEAREQIKKLAPDVITLDVEMPNMNGIEFLEKIMRLRPMPVIMVSSLTQSGAEITLQALELGAVDCVAKPAAGGDLNVLVETVKAASRARVKTFVDRPVSAPRREFRSDGRIVAIGSSTGGVEALATLLSTFPADCPPTLITQHMPASFTKSFAQRLDRTCAPNIVEAFDGALVEPGRVYIAPGGDQHLELQSGQRVVCRLRPGDPVNGHRPSVDVLFKSVAAHAGPAAVGVILTGMGRDGADGLLAMRKAGARTLGQDEKSSVVYGMPKAALSLGAVEKQLRLDRIGPAILDLCDAAARREAC